jgi:hypothetical protein
MVGPKLSIFRNKGLLFLSEVGENRYQLPEVQIDPFKKILGEGLVPAHRRAYRAVLPSGPESLFNRCSVNSAFSSFQPPFP